MTKTKLAILDARQNRDAIDRIFKFETVVKWTSSFDHLNNHIVTIEWIPSRSEIDEDTCLICMSEKVDGDCGIVLGWKGGEKERVNTCTCLDCFDELQNNYVVIRNNTLPSKTGLDELFWS